MKYQLSSLKYDASALAPYVSEQTLTFHHGKHLQTYVDNLNKLIEGSYLSNISLEGIIKEAGGPIFNNAAQVWNHNFYFEGMSPNGGGEPFGNLGEAIDDCFGSFAFFKEHFITASTSVFGSGWTWLVKNADNKLAIIQTTNAENPIKSNLIALMTCDLWEHAYYLDYQNDRAKYVENYFNVIDWEVAEEKFNKLSL